MADIRMNIEATDNGSFARVNREAQQVHNTVAKTQALLNRSTPQQSAPRPASQTAASQKANTSIEGGAYGVARGTVGTGAEGRDFAKTAQGLGGLVHVYATFAANIFAVSAAFTALSKAADYTNMIKGMDQLGAASGRSLGTFAKNIQGLTDGAVSLKEAMSVVATGNAAGLTTNQMERMAVGAKKLSQALGRDTSDSLSRLSRGITKIEPELLDELGIFVKVDKAARDYALSLGKTSASLTEYEKRQSLAVAVLAQMDKKYGEIKLDANPYSKLLATFTDVAYKGGELINTVLSPIAKFMGESPTAMGIAIAAIAGSLLNKAIPALTQWKQGLAEAAKVSADRAREIAQTHEAFVANRIASTGEKEVSAINERMNNSIAAIQGAISRALPATSKLVKALTSDTFMIDDDSIKKNLTKYNTALTNAKNKLASSEKLRSSTSDKDVIAAIDQRIAKEKEEVAQLKLAILETEALKKARIDASKVNERVQTELNKDPAFLSQEAALARRQKVAERKATKAAIYNNIGNDVETVGMSEAYNRLKESVKAGEEKLGTFQSKVTMVSGSLRILGSGILNIVSSFSQWAMIAGMVVSGLVLVYSFISRNRREAAEYDESIEKLNNSTKTFSETLAKLSKEDPLEQLSADNILAKSTAVNELSNSLIDSVDKLSAKLKAQNFVDAILYKISEIGIFGKTEIEKQVDSFTSTVATLLDQEANGENKAKAEAAIRSMLDIKDGVAITKESMSKALDGLGEIAVSKMKVLSPELSKLGKGLSAVGQQAKAFDESIKQTTKTFDQLMVSFMPSDNLSKLGIDMMKMGQEMSKSLENPEVALVRLHKMLSDPSELKLLDPAVLDKYKTDFGAIEILSNKIGSTQKEINDLTSQQNKLASDEVSKREQIARQLDEQKKKLEGLTAEAKKYTSTLGDQLSTSAFNNGVKLVKQGSDKVVAEAQISLSKTALAPIANTSTGVKMSAELDKKAIDLQIAMLQSQKALIEAQIASKVATDENTAVQRERALLEQKTAIEQKGSSATLADRTKYKEIEKELPIAEEARKKATAISKQLSEAKGIGNLSITKETPAELTQANLAIYGIVKNIGALALKKKEIDINTSFSVIDKDTEAWKKNQDIIAKDIDTSLARLNLYTGPYSALIEAKKEELLVSKDQLAISAKQREIEDFEAKKAIMLANIKDPVKRGEARSAANEQLNLMLNEKLALQSDLALKAEERKLKVLQQEFDYNQRLNFLDEKRTEINVSNLNTQKRVLDIAASIYNVNQQEYIKAQASIDIKIAREESALKIAKQTQDFNREQFALKLKIQALEKLGDANRTVEQTEALKQYNNQLSEQTLIHKMNLEMIKAQTEQSIELMERSRDASLFMEKWGSSIKAVEDTLTDVFKTAIDGGGREGLKKIVEGIKQRSKDLIFEVVYKPMVDDMKNAFIKMLPGGTKFLEDSKPIANKQLDQLIAIRAAIEKQNIDNSKGIKDIDALINSKKSEEPSIKNDDGLWMPISAPITEGGTSIQEGGKTIAEASTGILGAVQGFGQWVGKLFGFTGNTGVLGTLTGAANTVGSLISTGTSLVNMFTGTTASSIGGMIGGGFGAGMQVGSGALTGGALLDAGTTMGAAGAAGQAGMFMGQALPYIGLAFAAASLLEDNSPDTVRGKLSVRGTSGDFEDNAQVKSKYGYVGFDDKSTENFSGKAAQIAAKGLIDTLDILTIQFGGTEEAAKKLTTSVQSIDFGNLDGTYTTEDWLKNYSGNISRGLIKAIRDSNFEGEVGQAFNALTDEIIAGLNDEQVNTIMAATTSGVLKLVLQLVDENSIGLEGVLDAITTVTEKLPGLQQKFGVTADIIAKNFSEALTKSKSAAEAGEMFAGLVTNSIYDSLQNQYVNDITNTVMNNIINPMLAAMSLGQTAAQALQSKAVQDSIAMVTTLAANYKALMESPEVKAALDGLKGILTGAGSAGYVPGPTRYNPDKTDTTNNNDSKTEDAANMKADTELAIAILRKETTQKAEDRVKELAKWDDTIDALLKLKWALEDLAGLRTIFNKSTVDADAAIRKVFNKVPTVAEKLADITNLDNIDVDLSNIMTRIFDSLDPNTEAGQKAITTLDSLTEELTAMKAAADEYVSWNDKLRILTGKTTDKQLQREKDLAAATTLATKAIIKQVYAQEELADNIGQESRIYELLGNSEEALRLSREQELLTMEPHLKARQQYIWALEDEAAIRDKLTTKLEETSGSMKDIIDNLSSTIKDLQMGDLSTLSPQQKYTKAYEDAKSIYQTILKYQNPANDAEQKLLKDALDKAPEAANALATASRGLYASSSKYASDFNDIIDALTNSKTIATKVQTDSEKLLEANKKTADNTETIAELLTKLAAAQGITATAKGVAAAAGSAAADTTKYKVTKGDQTLENSYINAINKAYKTSTGREATNEELLTWMPKLAATGATSDSAFTNLQNIALPQVRAWVAENFKKLTGLDDWMGAVDHFTTKVWDGSIKVNELESVITKEKNWKDVLYATFNQTVGRTPEGTEVLSYFTDLRSGALSSASLAKTIREKLKPELETRLTKILTNAFNKDVLTNNPSGKAEFDGWISKIIEGSETYQSALAEISRIKPVAAMATGGFATGLTLVGEEGPEFVDFTATPGQVYTNAQTRGMFADNTELVDAVNALRQEIAQLREEQRQQTGDLIASNYDATIRAASEFADTIETSTSMTLWNTKSQPKLA